MVYGRFKIVNLTKKCKLAFQLITEAFTLMDLIYVKLSEHLSDSLITILLYPKFKKNHPNSDAAL